jgi:hypothetical protein
VKLIKASKGKYQILLAAKEKDLLLLILRLYPAFIGIPTT